MSYDAVEKLTAAMAAGNEDAVETFYRRYFDWLYAQASRATRRDEAFCLDVVQDAVLRVIRNVRTTQTEGQFRAWLKLVVQTTALDLLRSERRRVRREQSLVLASVGAAADPPAAPQLFDVSEVDWLQRQIARLDPKIVHLIELRYHHGWTLARIAKHLGISIGTVDGRLRRALKYLRNQVHEDDEDDVDV